MFSHIFMGVRDFDRALAFYRQMLPILGWKERFCEPIVPWAGWQQQPNQRPYLIIGHPYDGRPHEVGNGQMIALLAISRQMVDDAHATALVAGALCEGPPGLRMQYHPNYYGAYFRDTEGNKLCVACHEAVS